MTGWLVWLPDTEAVRIAGPYGPLADDGMGYPLPGEIRLREDGAVLLDDTAVRSLRMLTDDFRVVDQAAGYELVIGLARYPLEAQ